MKVKDLIIELLKQNLDSEVILQKDSEGNGYSPLYVVDNNAIYVPNTTWSGTVYSLAWSNEDAGMSIEEWEKMKQKPRCTVLAPTN